MHGHALLEFFAHDRSFPRLPQSAPEGRVQKNHVNGIGSNARCQLLEIDDDGIRRCRNSHELPQAAHSFQAEAWIFEIIVVQVFDLFSDSNCLFDRPSRVWVDTNSMMRKG